MTLNILGTNYTVLVKKYSEYPDFEKNEITGCCDGVLKQIVICDMPTYKGYEQETQEFCDIVQKETLRHEIVHAFFNESGLQSSSLSVNGPWAKNEELVDWIALQGIKIYKAWEKAGAL